MWRLQTVGKKYLKFMLSNLNSSAIERLCQAVIKYNKNGTKLIKLVYECGIYVCMCVSNSVNVYIWLCVCVCVCVCMGIAFDYVCLCVNGYHPLWV